MVEITCNKSSLALLSSSHPQIFNDNFKKYENERKTMTENE
jgi:hypothetical protein